MVNKLNCDNITTTVKQTSKMELVKVGVYPLMVDQQTSNRAKEKMSTVAEEDKYAYTLVGKNLKIQKDNGIGLDQVVENFIFRMYCIEAVNSIYKIVGDIMIRNEKGVEYSVEFSANRAKVENFSFSDFYNEEPLLLDLSLELLKDSEGIRWNITMHETTE